jgi:hypothetical protein
MRQEAQANARIAVRHAFGLVLPRTGSRAEDSR